jgi:phosphoserine phosphatase
MIGPMSSGIEPIGEGHAPARDLVLQSPDLTQDAIDAFASSFAPRAIARREGAARLYGVSGGLYDGVLTARALADAIGCDAALVPSAWKASEVRVIAFDMDSTIITIECIDEIAALAGRGPEVAAITAAAMRGEIPNFSESLVRRVALLEGAPASLLGRVLTERLRLSPGAARIVAFAKSHNWQTLLVSGGFTFFTRELQRRLGFDETCANELDVAADRLTGKVRGAAEDGGRIVDAEGKARALVRFCQRAGCPASAAIAVGDGANDLRMMVKAGASVAWRAKPRVREQARFSLDHSGLDAIANLFADTW